VPCAVLVLLACSDSDPEPIDPTAVNLAGEWVLSGRWGRWALLR
jgi:hypothetical protein